MKIKTIPWGKDPNINTSQEASSKDWAYWQNRINRASLVMLANEGLIPKDEARTIAQAQKKAEDIQDSQLTERFSDIMPLEKLLIDQCGQLATLIHTGRSRQDIFTTLNQARLRQATLDFFDSFNSLRSRLLEIATQNTDTWIPAYTNGVQAMPISLGFYLWGFLESMQRDADRLNEAWERINQSALGVGVLACSSWPLNRERLANLLGFDRPIVNGLDAAQISLFDIPLEAASIVGNIAIRIGVMVQDLAQQYSQTKPWLLLDQSAAYGSSAMPQKRNPGILNKTRAVASDVVGAMQTSYLRAHNINLGMYDNKESVLEDCSALFVKGCLMVELMEHAFSLLKIDKKRAAEELNHDWTSTMALAETLQHQFKVPFRVGHTFASQIVTDARSNSYFPDTYPYERAMKIYGEVSQRLEGKEKALPLDEGSFRIALSPEHAVTTRIGEGSPNPEETQKGLEGIAERLEADKKLHNVRRNLLTQCDQSLDEAFEALLTN